MAEISYFQNAELEGDGIGTEDEYGRGDDQALGDIDTDKDGGCQLTPLDRLFQHAESQLSTERQLVGKLLVNIFQNAVKSKLSVNPEGIFKPVNHIIYDKDPSVRSSLVECLPHVALICNDSADLFNDDIIGRILTIVLLFLNDPDNQVRQDAQTALRTLLERDLLDDDQVEQEVCGAIIELSRSHNTELQALALTLMAKMNMYIPDELIEELFLDRFIELCSSEGFFVRRVCASIMGEFCTLFSEESIYNKILPTYAHLCLDHIWGVRKTSVDVMMSVARRVRRSMRRRLLSKLLVNHLRDESRWVRRSAYEILGPFISTFAKQFHELIFDQKGELVLVHESERGGPRFNVVPVVKASDILTENLHEEPYANADKLMKKLRKRTLSFNVVRKKDNQKFCSNKNSTSKSNEKFNLFQYYYDPPDIPLDPELVNSIVKSHETIYPDNTNIECVESGIAPLDDENKNTSNESDTLQQNTYNNSNSEENQEYFKNDDNQNSDNNDDDKENNFNNKNEESEKENDTRPENDISWNSHASLTDLTLTSNNPEKSNYEIKEMPLNELYTILRAKKEEKSKMKEQTYRMMKEKQHEKLKALVNSIYNSNNDTAHLSWDSSLDQSASPNLSDLRLSLLSNLNVSDDNQEDDEIVPSILVDHFVSMADLPSTANPDGPDLDYHCAYSFPAVVLTLGKDNWHRLKDAYQKLASAVAWKVRSTLACGIHEIAVIIGKEYAARDLIPIFNGFIKDLEEVRIGALKHFSRFLRVLSPQDRVPYLPKLNDFLITDNNRNWRLREELVKQLAQIIYLYEPMDVAQYIAPLMLHLMQDKVAAVRAEALYAVSKTIAYLACDNDDPLAIAMIQEMRDLMISHASGEWVIRQTYALVCSRLIRDHVISSKVFTKELLSYLLELTTDKVPNVRLVVARTLSRNVLKMPNFPKKFAIEIEQKLKEMEKDTDRDVRFFATKGIGWGSSSDGIQFCFKKMKVIE